MLSFLFHRNHCNNGANKEQGVLNVYIEHSHTNSFESRISVSLCQVDIHRQFTILNKYDAYTHTSHSNIATTHMQMCRFFCLPSPVSSINYGKTKTKKKKKSRIKKQSSPTHSSHSNSYNSNAIRAYFLFHSCLLDTTQYFLLLTLLCLLAVHERHIRYCMTLSYIQYVLCVIFF